MAPLLIVATADNHLSRYHARMTPSRLSERRLRLRQGFAAVVTYAIEHRAGLLLHGGDLFDSPTPSNADLLFVADCLDRLHDAGVRVLAVSGNHDTPSGTTIQGGVPPLSPLASLHGLTLFPAGTVGVEEVRVGGQRLSVAGYTPPSGQHALDPLEVLLQSEGADAEVFITHASIEKHAYPGASEPVLRFESARRLPNLKLVVAGHLHKFVMERAGQVHLVAPGATERMTFGEMDSQPGFVALEYDGGRVTSVTHVPTGAQPRVSLTLDPERVGDDPHGTARQLIESHGTPDTLVRLVVRGRVHGETYAALKLRELQDYGAVTCFQFELDATGLYLEDGFRQDVARGVRVSQEAEIAEVANEMVAAAEDPAERELLVAARETLLGEYA